MTSIQQKLKKMDEKAPLITPNLESGHESINKVHEPVKKPPISGLIVAYFTVFLDTFGMIG